MLFTITSPFLEIMPVSYSFLAALATKVRP
jgi:hypothetical protein